MKARKRMGLALGLGAALAVGQFVSVGGAPGAPQPTKDKAEPAPASVKGQRAQEFIAAFDKGDAKAVAAFWAEDADYVDQVGRQYKGRAAMEAMYAKLFAAQKGAKLNIIVTSARMVGADTAIEDGITEITPAAGGLPTAARFSAVLVKKDGSWYLASVRDSIPLPPSNAEHLDDMEWLLGDWAGEAEKGESGRASYAWAENRNFIVSSFATTLDGFPVVGGTQWIGWDAVENRVRSWTFYSGGGFGEAVWAKVDGKWVSKFTAKTADGKKLTGTNTLTAVGADHLTWQTSDLTVDGKAMPPLPPQKLKRVKP